MSHSNPLHRATHAIPVAALSLLLLSAGMCSPAEETPPAEIAERQAEEQRALEAALARSAAEAAAEAEEKQRLAAESAAAAERERQLAAREQELREQEARLAEERRLQRERELEAEQQRLAAERAAAAERQRQLAAREQELREQEEALARREEELAAAETAAPEPLPEPTGSYQGNFDEPWRESQETAQAEPGEAAPPATTKTTVRAGERLEVQIVDTLSSETAREGDRFSTRLVGDLRDASGRVVIPAGAEVVGRVTEAVPYRRGGGPATLAVEFHEIVVSPEQRVGIRASFAELGADRSKNRKKVVAGAVVGAILGHILGGDGSKNVIIGAAAGAAAGGAVVASARDRDAEIPAGQIIALQLEEVVTVEIEYGAVAGR